MKSASKTPESTIAPYLEKSVKAPDGIPETALQAVHLARAIQIRAMELQTPAEQHQQAELERMMRNPQDKATLMQITDQAFRSHQNRRSADQLIHILDVQGIPRFFGWWDRAMLKGFQNFGNYLPGVTLPLVREKMREETANVVLPAEADVLKAHLKERQRNGLRMNVNFLGEALLGEAEAKKRLNKYLSALQRPELEVLSVKISTLYSQISPLSRDQTVRVLSDRLEVLFQATLLFPFQRQDGTTAPKFLYLDMEEYRDLQLTAEAFMRTLERPGMQSVRGGIALQAYIQDSYAVQRTLNDWARKRVAAGGAPITIRLVKGANLEMERVEASIQGWPQAPFLVKADTDSNYKRMLYEALRPENLEAVHVGVASHNLFDLSYAMLLAARERAFDKVQFEMLEGMANHQRRALQESAVDLLLYAPATTREGFIHAIGYLVRRLDENTGPDNFLRHAFKIEVNSPAWTRLEEQFLEGFRLIDTLPDQPRRTQNRSTEDPAPGSWEEPFINEPDTDFALRANGEWALQLRNVWMQRHGELAAEIPLSVGGGCRKGEDREVVDGRNPSHPGQVVTRCHLASLEDVREALAHAGRDPGGWRQLPAGERAEILMRAANEIRRRRADLIGAAMVEAGKVISESDPEVSEAVDFVAYYTRQAQSRDQADGLAADPLGTVVVIPPWNFPTAIPCGGVAAALATGNCVILKPAPETPLCAYLICQCFWEAGVPRDALQFLPCREQVEGTALVTSEEVDLVVLTGGTVTARKFLEMKPDMGLLAETGGKNATIVTALSDREQAVRHVLQSAFGHAGQKCSATSLLILEAEVYDDPAFRELLVDAASSLKVGPADALDTRIGPLIHPPCGDLERGLKDLEPGESWALEPKCDPDNPHLWSPGIKWDVVPGSYTHLTEFFGPVLAVMRAGSLQEAIQWVNATGYGLTSGLESLDEREQEMWRRQVRAGNLYINRPTTGAVVQRQPFGGMGKSAFGPGIKAGGPNYTDVFLRWTETSAPKDSGERNIWVDLFLDQAPSESSPRVMAGALTSYQAALQQAFGREEDFVKLVGQDNLFRYLPVRKLILRITEGVTAEQVHLAVAAGCMTGAVPRLSLAPEVDMPHLGRLVSSAKRLGLELTVTSESEKQLIGRLDDLRPERIRYLGESVPETGLQREAGQRFIYIYAAPVSYHGQRELLHYLREQSISHNYHRYGNLGMRAKEIRRPVL